MVSLTNQFLIAMPSLADPNFFRSVTLICQHNADGAMGIVINRPTDLSMGEILQQMDIDASKARHQSEKVYHGGPVQNERGFILHDGATSWSSSLTVSDELSLTTSRDILEALAQDRGPNRCLVALGYAGWGGGQLEDELSQNAWLNGPADHNIIFDTPAEHRWNRAAQHLGVDLDRLSSQTGHA